MIAHRHRRFAQRLVLPLACSLALLGGCGGGCTPIEQPETCASAGAVSGVTGLEIGTFVDGIFAPLSDGDVLELVYGGQGAAMAPIALRVTGTGLPSCMPQSTIIYDDRNDTLGEEAQPVETYAEGDRRYTKALYIVLGFSDYQGMRGRIEARVGATQLTRTVYFGFVGSADAAPDPDADAAADPDATAADAGEAGDGGALQDAATADGAPADAS